MHSPQTYPLCQHVPDVKCQQQLSCREPIAIWEPQCFPSPIPDGWGSCERGSRSTLVYQLGLLPTQYLLGYFLSMRYFFGYQDITVYQVMLLMYFATIMVCYFILHGGWWTLTSSVWYLDVIVSQIITFIFCRSDGWLLHIRFFCGGYYILF